MIATGQAGEGAGLLQGLGERHADRSGVDAAIPITFFEPIPGRMDSRKGIRRVV